MFCKRVWCVAASVAVGDLRQVCCPNVCCVYGYDLFALQIHAKWSMVPCTIMHVIAHHTQLGIAPVQAVSLSRHICMPALVSMNSAALTA